MPEDDTQEPLWPFFLIVIVVMGLILGGVWGLYHVEMGCPTKVPEECVGVHR